MDKSKTYTYFANGISIDSEIKFPELREQKIKQVEVTIRFGKVPESISHPIYQGPTSQAGDGKYLLEVKNVATYFLKKSDHNFSITVSPLENVPLSEIRLFILSSMLGAVCHMKGFLPLHASGVVINNKAILFCGKSGLGKSTICASLYKHGYPFITDNLAAIFINKDGIPHVHPSYPHFKLWDDSIEALDEIDGSLKQIRPKVHKKNLLLENNLQETPIPLHKIYHLNRRFDEKISIEELTGSKKAEIILNETFRIKLLKSLGETKTYFNTLNQICQSIDVSKIYRSSETFALDNLTQKILSNLEEPLN